MSIRIMSTVWEVQWPSQTILLVALKLADVAGDNGRGIYPSKKTVAKKTLTSMSTVKRVIRTLLACDILRIDLHHPKTPKNTTPYQFNLQLLNSLEGFAVEIDDDGGMHVFQADEDPSEIEGGATVTQATNCAQGQKRGLGGSLGGRPPGSPDDPQSIPNPSRTLRACARSEDSKLDLKGKGAQAAIELKASDVSWRDWMRHLGSINRGDLVDQATAAGRMTVTARWPTAQTPLPSIPQVGLTERSKAMVGEGA